MLRKRIVKNIKKLFILIVFLYNIFYYYVTKAIERAMRECTEISGQNIKTCVVQFKVSTQGITLTDMSRRFVCKKVLNLRCEMSLILLNCILYNIPYFKYTKVLIFDFCLLRIILYTSIFYAYRLKYMACNLILNVLSFLIFVSILLVLLFDQKQHKD